MILIVENDEGNRVLLQEAVFGLSAQIVVCTSLEEAYAALETQQFQLVIADRMLDDGDGMELVEYLDAESFSTKTMIVSQLGQLPERVSGLETGADEYLAKPFSLAELRLKAKILLQREKMQPSTVLRAGGLELYPETGSLKIGQTTHTLRKRVTHILAYLMRHKNQVITRDALIDAIWGSTRDTPTHSTIDVYMRRIRMVLGAHGSVIKTVRGFGYSFVDRE